MIIAKPIQLRSKGHDLDMDERSLGRYRDCSDMVGDLGRLREHMREEGYVFLRGYLDCEDVLEARRAMTERLAAEGILDPEHPAMEAVAHPDYRGDQAHLLARDCPELEKVLYAGPMMAFFEGFLGRPVYHYTYTWLRALAPGVGTPMHCDVVYMGRGARSNLYTAWTPLGAIDLELGGLMMLERSHLLDRLRNTYCKRDVDAWCTNRRGGDKVKTMNGENGILAPDPNRIRKSLGGRWFVGEFEPGDLIVFNVFMVHAGLDNQSDRIRLSSDSRYQPADEPFDDRWNGPDPPRHGPRAKRGMVC
ncbi:MAG: phytanoyl-CoA dioxygenase [Phycisphaeraceae bacterium]|nr:phytanoyl-CoA dioxygenase [Phycisphaeraceae bacterium]